MGEAGQRHLAREVAEGDVGPLEISLELGPYPARAGRGLDLGRKADGVGRVGKRHGQRAPFDRELDIAFDPGVGIHGGLRFDGHRAVDRHLIGQERSEEREGECRDVDLAVRAFGPGPGTVDADVGRGIHGRTAGRAPARLETEAVDPGGALSGAHFGRALEPPLSGVARHDVEPIEVSLPGRIHEASGRRQIESESKAIAPQERGCFVGAPRAQGRQRQ